MLNLPFWLRVSYLPQTTRLSTRGREPASRVRRARRRDVQVSADMQRPITHEDLDEHGRVGGEVGEIMGRSELSAFLREIESPSSPPGEGLTARDILEAHRMFEEGGGGFEVVDDAEAGPLAGAELRMHQHANRQVTIFLTSFFCFDLRSCWMLVLLLYV